MEGKEQGMADTEQRNVDVRSIIREAINEFVSAEQQKAEPAYKAELLEERKRREQLESRLNELVEENRRSRAMAEEVERNATIRTELQRMGVNKIDLAFRAVKDDIGRDQTGRLVAKRGDNEMNLKEYLSEFVAENPELLPARIHGGSGAGPTSKSTSGHSSFDLDKIKPGMSAEELERARLEITRIASQGLRGQ